LALTFNPAEAQEGHETEGADLPRLLQPQFRMAEDPVDGKIRMPAEKIRQRRREAFDEGPALGPPGEMVGDQDLPAVTGDAGHLIQHLLRLGHHRHHMHRCDMVEAGVV